MVRAANNVGIPYSFLLLLLASLAAAFAPSSRAQHLISNCSTISASPLANATPESVERHCEKDPNDMRFGRFVIPEASVFCRTERAAAFVNLRPLVRGHVLVIPTKVLPRLDDLEEADYAALWGMVRRVQATLQRAYPATTAFNVAVQDGRAAGQSVPHVHVHVLPRSGGDFARNDDVYEALEAWAPTAAMAAAKEKADIEVPDDADRVDRTLEQMADEAAMYRRLLE